MGKAGLFTNNIFGYRLYVIYAIIGASSSRSLGSKYYFSQMIIDYCKN